MNKIKYDELDWEDPCSEFGAIYNGEKFSGVAYDEEQSYYAEFHFKQGLAHGRNFQIDKNTNQIWREEFYDSGVPVKTHFNWAMNYTKKHIRKYEDGVMIFAQIENELGQLLFEFDRKTKEIKEWYFNGISVLTKY